MQSSRTIPPGRSTNAASISTPGYPTWRPRYGRLSTVRQRGSTPRKLPPELDRDIELGDAHPHVMHGELAAGKRGLGQRTRARPSATEIAENLLEPIPGGPGAGRAAGRGPRRILRGRGRSKCRRLSKRASAPLMAPVDPDLRTYCLRRRLEAARVGSCPSRTCARVDRDARGGGSCGVGRATRSPRSGIWRLRERQDRGPLRVRLYRPAGVAPLPGLLWLHGGGWVVGSITTHDLLCRAIAAQTRACVRLGRLPSSRPSTRFPPRCGTPGRRWAGCAIHADELGIDSIRRSRSAATAPAATSPP